MRQRALVVALAAAALAVGCVSLEERVPPVDGAVLSAAGSRAFSPEQVVRGREVYLNACTRCHSAQHVAGYSAGAWEPILQRMSEESSLGPDDSAAVRAYVLAALASREGRTVNGAR